MSLFGNNNGYQDLFGRYSSAVSDVTDLTISNSLTLTYADANKNLVTNSNQEVVTEDKDTITNTDGNVQITQISRNFDLNLNPDLNLDSLTLTNPGSNVPYLATDATGKIIAAVVPITTVVQGTANQITVTESPTGTFTVSLPSTVITSIFQGDLKIPDTVGDNYLTLDVGYNMPADYTLKFNLTGNYTISLNANTALNQDLQTTNSPTFSGLTLSSLAGGGTLNLEIDNSGNVIASPAVLSTVSAGTNIMVDVSGNDYKVSVTDDVDLAGTLIVRGTYSQIENTSIPQLRFKNTSGGLLGFLGFYQGASAEASITVDQGSNFQFGIAQSSSMDRFFFNTNGRFIDVDGYLLTENKITEAKLFQTITESPGATAGDHFAFRNAYTMNDEYLVCGSPNYFVGGVSNGSIFIYIKNYKFEWTLLQQITDPNTAVLSSNHSFGDNVWFSRDQSLLFVSAPNGSTTTFGSGVGIVYVYKNDMKKTATSFTLHQTLSGTGVTSADSFGDDMCCSMCGNYLFVGADTDASGGSLYIFKLQYGQWTQIQHIVEGTVSAGDRYGLRPCVSDDDVLVVSAINNNTNGTAFVYHHNKSTDNWDLFQILDPGTATNDDFSNGLTISNDAQYILCGARIASKLYIYHYDYLTDQYSLLQTITGTASTNFGINPACYPTCDYFYVSANLNDTSAVNAGRTFLYKREEAGTFSLLSSFDGGAIVNNDFGIGQTNLGLKSQNVFIGDLNNHELVYYTDTTTNTFQGDVDVYGKVKTPMIEGNGDCVLVKGGVTTDRICIGDPLFEMNKPRHELQPTFASTDMDLTASTIGDYSVSGYNDITTTATTGFFLEECGFLSHSPGDNFRFNVYGTNAPDKYYLVNYSFSWEFIAGTPANIYGMIRHNLTTDHAISLNYMDANHEHGTLSGTCIIKLVFNDEIRLSCYLTPVGATVRIHNASMTCIPVM